MAPRTNVLSRLRSSKMIQITKIEYESATNCFSAADTIGRIVRRVC